MLLPISRRRTRHEKIAPMDQTKPRARTRPLALPRKQERRLLEQEAGAAHRGIPRRALGACPHDLDKP